MPSKRLIAALVSLLALPALLIGGAGCGDPPSPALVSPGSSSPAPPRLDGLAPWGNAWVLAHGESYLEDREARRAAMERSLTRPDNLYSQTRLGAYGRGPTGGGWDALPVWSPRVVPIDRARADALARGEDLVVPDGTPPFHDGSRPTTWQGWAALGRRVFHELPLRTEPYWLAALRDPEVAARLGISRAPDGSVPGLVLARDLDGSTGIAITCALCHAASSVDGARLVDGRARRELDYGLARIELARALGRPLSPEAEARFRSWGRGRADVLEELSDVPIAIPDLYGLRHQRWLTQGATLRHESPIGLAVRQETQYIQANHLHTRPPRELMWALVVYLYAIEMPPRATTPGADVSSGRALFDEHCQSCHWNEVGSGDPVSLARVGTEPELASGRARGTGTYRPSPLVRTREAAPYLHHGAVASLEELLSPTRAEPGHRFGTELGAEDRAALIAYLDTL